MENSYVCFWKRTINHSHAIGPERFVEGGGRHDFQVRVSGRERASERERGEPEEEEEEEEFIRIQRRALFGNRDNVHDGGVQGAAR